MNPHDDGDEELATAPDLWRTGLFLVCLVTLCAILLAWSSCRRAPARGAAAREVDRLAGKEARRG